MPGSGSTGPTFSPSTRPTSEAVAGRARAKARRSSRPSRTAAPRTRPPDDLSAYIDAERVELERENECLARYERYLRRLGILTDEAADEARAEALETMRAGIAAAEALPEPNVELTTSHAYVD